MVTKSVKNALKLLLVATENPANAGVLAALRVYDGIAVQHAQSLPEALAALDSHEVEMLLVLPPLPPAEAQPLLRTVHKHCPSCPFIITSSEEFYTEARQWFPAHAVHLIPVNAENIACLPGRIEEIVALARFEQRTETQALRERLLQMVVGLTPVLLAEFDLDALLQRIVEEAVRLIPHAEGGSLLLKEDGDFAFRGLVGYDVRLKTLRLPGGTPFVAALQRGESVHLHRIVQRDRKVFPPQIVAALQKYGRVEEIEETLAIPLLFAGQLLGYLTVDSFTAGQTFDPVEEEGLRHFAALATIALHNTRLLLAEKQARALAETIQQIGATLTATLDLEAVLDRLLKALFHLTPCDAADIMLVEAGEATIVRQRGYERFGYTETAQGIHFPLRQTANLQAAARQRAPLIIANTQTYDGWVTIPGAEWMRSHIATPIFLDRELVGFLCAISTQAGKFSPEDGAALAALAPLAAVALHNARLHQETQRAFEDLQRLDAMKSQFVQNVTHELRTPLSIVKGYVDLALDEDFGFNVSAELSQSLTAIQLYTNRLVELVESITALENVETGQLLLQPQPILPVILRSIQAVRQKALCREVDVLADLPALLPQVNLDPQQLGLVLWHLLDNATKFSMPGGKVWLRAWAENDEVRCQVQDEGIGIPPDEQERIFQRFYQVDGSIRRKYPGMGLGLSLVKGIVEKHGGRVWLTSEGSNRGATFTLALPIYHPEQEGVA